MLLYDFCEMPSTNFIFIFIKVVALREILWVITTRENIIKPKNINSNRLKKRKRGATTSYGNYYHTIKR